MHFAACGPLVRRPSIRSWTLIRAHAAKADQLCSVQSTPACPQGPRSPNSATEPKRSCRHYDNMRTEDSAVQARSDVPISDGFRMAK